MIFYIERYSVDATFQLVIAGRPLRALRNSSYLYYQFGPQEGRQRTDVVLGELEGANPALMMSSASLAVANQSEHDPAGRKPLPLDIFSDESLAPERLHAMTWFGVGWRKNDMVRLDLGAMDAPIAALNKCTEDLVAHWGIDLEKHRHLTRAVEPVGNPANWIRPSDYPASMLSQGKQGLVQFRIMVGPDGKPTSCHIQQSTRPQEFDDAVCNSMMKHAEFKPAFDDEARRI